MTTLRWQSESSGNYSYKGVTNLDTARENYAEVAFRKMVDSIAFPF